MPQSSYDSNPALCNNQFDPYFRIGSGACFNIRDSSAIAIGLGVYFGVTLISACALAYVVKTRRNGSCSQLACWFCIGFVFSVMAWYVLLPLTLTQYIRINMMRSSGTCCSAGGRSLETTASTIKIKTRQRCRPIIHWALPPPPAHL